MVLLLLFMGYEVPFFPNFALLKTSLYVSPPLTAQSENTFVILRFALQRDHSSCEAHLPCITHFCCKVPTGTATECYINPPFSIRCLSFGLERRGRHVQQCSKTVLNDSCHPFVCGSLKCRECKHSGTPSSI